MRDGVPDDDEDEQCDEYKVCVGGGVVVECVCWCEWRFSGVGVWPEWPALNGP